MTDPESQPVRGRNVAESMLAIEQRDPVRLLDQWRRGVRIAHIAHTRAATEFAGRNRVLGIGATVSTAVVGTTLFTSLSNSNNQNLVLVAALMSVVAIVLTALQTFLNYGDLVTSHRAAANAYGDLRRRIEQLLVFGDAAQLQEPMAEIAGIWTKLEQDSVDVPQRIYAGAAKSVAQREAAGDQGVA